MRVGDTAEVTRAFAASDVDAYADLSRHGGIEGEVPEPLIGALFSYLLGARLPGFGTNYLKQEMRYLSPARIGEPLTARVEVTRIRPEKQLVDLSTTCTDASGQTLATGRALVLARDVDDMLETPC
jgi:hypothetical protein